MGSKVTPEMMEDLQCAFEYGGYPLGVLGERFGGVSRERIRQIAVANGWKRVYPVEKANSRPEGAGPNWNASNWRCGPAKYAVGACKCPTCRNSRKQPTKL